MTTFSPKRAGSEAKRAAMRSEVSPLTPRFKVVMPVNAWSRVG
jgi:hypothetical protein